jgi:hypothetical protein
VGLRFGEQALSIASAKNKKPFSPKITRGLADEPKVGSSPNTFWSTQASTRIAFERRGIRSLMYGPSFLKKSHPSLEPGKAVMALFSIEAALPPVVTATKGEKRSVAERLAIRYLLIRNIKSDNSL